ncbi:R3H domain-containing protein 4-like [Ruditapes philippinarum]|uniref:R3H domain-containing protein 4-like n=1 Tax=Ruditapes philippinarum TaxID=129788 RepID=UPI00295B6EDF|nr:R3H domain-containing protein 4-like [Ruditapes philippinarum]
MGVIKGKRDWLAYGMEEDMEHIIEPVSSSDNESVTNVPVSTPRRRAQRPKMRNMETSISDHINSRRKGQKQARRCDNLKELINMVEKEDIELDFNIFEPTISAFAELFNEHEKMKAWNDFVNSTEEEQMELLEGDCNHTGNHGNCEETSDLENNNSDLDNSWEYVEDKRRTHPSFSAEECFQKIDKNIRTMLKRRHKPMGLLVSIEEEIVNFFKEWPQSVYISKLSSSYERMMLHALCQYLDLISKSYDCDGLRQTQIENPQPRFTPPPVLLTHYLEHSRLS